MAKKKSTPRKGKGLASLAWNLAKAAPKLYGAYKVGKAGLNVAQKVGSVVSKVKNFGKPTNSTSPSTYNKLTPEIQHLFKKPEYKPITSPPGTATNFFERAQRAFQRQFFPKPDPIATQNVLEMDSLQGSKLSEKGRYQRVDPTPDAGLDKNSLIAKAADRLSNNAPRRSASKLFNQENAMAAIAKSPLYEAPDVWHDAEGRKKRRGGKRVDETKTGQSKFPYGHFDNFNQHTLPITDPRNFKKHVSQHWRQLDEPRAMAIGGKRRKGVVPPHLKPFLFKKKK